MTNIAILGFGVVGGGVAELITKNYSEITSLSGDEINIKYILDLRDFPNSPFGSRVVHDFDVILSDDEVSVIIEVMGGSHPAYEYTKSALKAGKSVITSNKEVVASFGDEFLKLAKDNGAFYLFEASVGGGIPVISPIINCIGQNKITEVRGILNGTTNYILTKMFSFGDSFENALENAKNLGYAERNPDADILGTDAARKIAILAALTTGKLIDVKNIHTEGITKIRKEDVSAANKLGMSIKLVGRCITTKTALYTMVAPFMIGADSPLSMVQGVYNAVEVIGEPIGNVMFYGKGAGAGATSSAVVADLMQIMHSGEKTITPKFEKSDDIADFSTFTSKNYFAFDAKRETIEKLIPSAHYLDVNESAFITPEISESEAEALIKSLENAGAKLLSRIRLL